MAVLLLEAFAVRQQLVAPPLVMSLLHQCGVIASGNAKRNGIARRDAQGRMTPRRNTPQRGA